MRTTRLQNDLRDMQALQRLNPGLLDYEVLGSGSPPDHYLVKLRVRGLRWDSTGPVFTLNHRFEVQLGPGYPTAPPETTWKTDLFHVNIAPPNVCHKGMWGPNWSLVRWVQILYDWVRWAAYNERSPLNGQAAAWIMHNPTKVPVDGRKLRLPN